MGEYSRTYQIIENRKEEIAALKLQIAHKDGLTNDELDYLYERLGNAEIELGEAEGYLAELESIDGVDYD